jgi:hypothetical protein
MITTHSADMNVSRLKSGSSDGSALPPAGAAAAANIKVNPINMPPPQFSKTTKSVKSIARAIHPRDTEFF